jgi:hypothetical protein
MPRSPHRKHHVGQFFCCPVGCHGNLVFSTCRLITTRSLLYVVTGTWFPIRCSITDVWLWIHYSGFQPSRHNIIDSSWSGPSATEFIIHSSWSKRKVQNFIQEQMEHIVAELIVYWNADAQDGVVWDVEVQCTRNRQYCGLHEALNTNNNFILWRNMIIARQRLSIHVPTSTQQ